MRLYGGRTTDLQCDWNSCAELSGTTVPMEYAGQNAGIDLRVLSCAVPKVCCPNMNEFRGVPMSQFHGLQSWFSRLVFRNKLTKMPALKKPCPALEILEGRALPAYTGGLSLGVGDYNSDGFNDMVSGAQAGSVPAVVVTSGKDGSVLNNFYAYDQRFRGGVNVAMSDMNGDGFDDVITGTAKGSDHVMVYSGKDGSVLSSFLAFDGFQGGISVAAGDVNNDGSPDLIIGALAGAQSRVLVMNATNNDDGTAVTFSTLRSFLAFDAGYSGGVNVACGDTNGDGNWDVVVGSATGTGHVKVFSGKNGAVLASYMAFDSGIQVASGDISSSNFADVVVSTTGNVPGGDVHIYKGATSTLFKSFQAIPGNTGGVNITVGSFSGDLTNEVIFASRGQGTGNVVIYNTSTRGVETTFSAFGNPSEPQPLTLYADTNQDADPFVSNRIADVQVSKNAANQTFNLTSNFSDPNASNGVVNVVTTSGTVQIELLNQQAPVNVKNFMSYVDGNKYDGTIFHRSVSNFVVQGGGYTVAGSAPNTTLNHIVTAPPVANEYSVTRSNVRGTVAMAKVGNDPNSATSEFFFNVANNAANLDNQNGGFTVFANVKTGLDKVDAINAIPTKNLGGAFTEIPTVNNFTGTTVAQANASNFVTINDMQVISRGELLTFSVIGNTNPTLVTPTIVGNNLTLDYSATATGSSVIQIRATDLSGRSVDTAFTVRVV